jgi:cytochrome c-type biogenesis protein CcmH/NrfG
MPNEGLEQPLPGSVWKAKQVYTMAAVCLLIGLAIGYLFHGSQSPAPSTQPVAGTQPSPAANAMGGHMPSLEEMKQMADKKAAPLLEKLQGDPNNGDLLFQVGNIYMATHQFKQAVAYYNKALQVNPKNMAVRTEKASCMYYDGDTDGAIALLQESLVYSPQDANSLFNLGVIKWQGKQDGKGALAAWRQLLKSNPQLSAERKAAVQRLMQSVQTKTKG